MVVSGISIKCVGLVALDVVPSWYKSQTALYFWFAAIGVAFASATFSEQNQSSLSFAFCVCVILRRITTKWVKTHWLKFLSTYVKDDCRPNKSFLSPPKSFEDLISVVVDGGPLHPGFGKLLNFCVGISFLMAVGQWIPEFGSWIDFCGIGQLWPNWWLPTSAFLLSLGVNGVLWIWSTCLKKSRGAHEGVHRMVEGTIQRKLSAQEHLNLVAWSFVNALCEEATSRGFNRWEFNFVCETEVKIKVGPMLVYASNLWQSTSFGLAHFYGVPSGWTGVALTFVYGLIMGILQDVGDGLLYPILTHTVADYFIFSQIARRR